MSNSKKIYKSIMLIVVVAMITFILTTVFMYNKLGTVSKYSNIQVVNSELSRRILAVKQIIDSEYISDIEEKDLMNGAVKGYVAGLGDDYSEYFTKEEMEEFRTETEGNYVGIGIYMVKNTKENTIVILSPIKGSPAEKAGILPGDVIKKVDEVEYTGEEFDKIASNIKGKEGTTVKITVERNKKILEFEVERKKIELYPIETEVLENNIGYIQISSFDEKCGKRFKEKYIELNKKGINSLIIDLRNNGGGIVDEALEIADYILDKNSIILITADKAKNEKIEKSTKKPIVNVPVIILTNENTASASEILTAALKENNKATVIGEETYGKGVIQELITLTDGSGIKITTEEYYTPNKNKINKIGIKPDIEVSLPETVENILTVERKYDTQLKEAIKIFKSTK